MDEIGQRLRDFLIAGRGNIDENDLQRYFEDQPQLLIVQPLHHGVVQNAVLSKFKIGHRATDFAYLTQTSKYAQVVYVELEPAYRQIFRKENRKATQPRTEVVSAISQVQEWKTLLRRPEVHLDVTKRLQTLLDREELVIEERFVLVIGEDLDETVSAEEAAWFATQRHSGIEIYTYGSLARAVVRPQSSVPNVLTEEQGKFKIKHLHSEPQFFATLSRNQLVAPSSEETEKLKSWGYEIEKWRNGSYLWVDFKYASLDAAAAATKTPVAAPISPEAVASSSQSEAPIAPEVSGEN